MTPLTTVVVPHRSDQDANLRPLPWRRMGWVTWRQHRVALIGLAALFVAMAAFIWVAGLHLHHAYAVAIACHPTSSFACYELVNTFDGMYGFLANGLLPQAVPPLIGALLGAPLLAREVEAGTFRFAWTQGIGRWRWTLAKLVALATLVTAVAGALNALMYWYYQPYFLVGNQASSVSKEVLIGVSSPFTPGLFDLRGVTFAAWTLAGFAIGVLAGILIRRVVPAILATLTVYTGLAFASGGFLREHYLAPLVTTKLSTPDSAWVITQQWFTKSGRLASPPVLSHVLQGAGQLIGKGGVPRSLNVWRYLAHHGYTLVTTYQPASRFWPFQWIEGGWLLALSALAMAATVWMVRRRAV